MLDDEDGFDVILIATGSEVGSALGAAGILRQGGTKVRVVSMPSCELFEAQDEAYHEAVLPASCVKRVTVEAGTTFGWARYAGTSGLSIGIDHFGDSAPYGIIAEEYGLTAEGIAGRVGDWLS